MTTDWGTFLNDTAQNLIGYKADQLTQPQTPVAVSYGGVPYVEGKPAPTQTAAETIMGVKPVYLALGVGALALVAFFAFGRK